MLTDIKCIVETLSSLRSLDIRANRYILHIDDATNTSMNYFRVSKLRQLDLDK